MIRVDYKKCTACNACVQTCPQKCINLEEDAFGFSYPTIDLHTCTDCNLCNSVCPLENRLSVEAFEKKAYAVVHKDKEKRLSATSGGAFGAIAEYVLKRDGVVYGCAYDDDLKAVHTRIDNIENLKALNGSKYVQSEIADTFIQAQEDLKKGKLVLFSGTPCQIAGLRSFLKTAYDNLITVDIVCHGVPSQAYFKKYIDWFSKAKNIKIYDYNFRSKKNSGWSCAGMYSGKDIKTDKPFESKLHYFDGYYYYYFLRGDIYRTSCYSCDYANLDRVGDFTLGDFWGAEGEKLLFSTKEGCSLVLINSEKAQAIFELLELQYSSVSIEKATRYNQQLTSPCAVSKKREKLLRRFCECSAEEIQKCFKKEERAQIAKARIKYLCPAFLKRFILKFRYR